MTSDARLAQRLTLAFAVLLALTFGLIVLGALVRANGAGLACPDWPLCFGRALPEFDVKVGFEWTHRVVAGGIALAFCTLSALVLSRPALRAAAGATVVVAAVLLVGQILLGALTVWKLLAQWTVTSHLVVGNAFAVCLLVISRQLGTFGVRGESAVSSGAGTRLAVTAAAVLLAAQVVLGGLVSSSYAGLACPEWPTCIDGQFAPGFEGALGLHLLHRFCAYALLLALTLAALVCRGSEELQGATLLALALGLAQVTVGIANVLMRIPVEVTGLHSALAAALVLTVARCFHDAWRGLIAQPATDASGPFSLTLDPRRG